MKISFPLTMTIFAAILFSEIIVAQTPTATDIVRKADEKFNGEKSSSSIMSMTIIRPGWKRTIEFKNWTLGRDYALTLITAPAKEAGQSFLKRGSEM